MLLADLVLPILRRPNPRPNPAVIAHFFVVSEVFGHGFLFGLFCLLATMVVTLKLLRWYYQIEPSRRVVGITIGACLAANTLLFLAIQISSVEYRPFHVGGLTASVLWTYFWWTVYPRMINQSADLGELHN